MLSVALEREMAGELLTYWAFNQARGCTRQQCNFSHSCSSCGSTKHGASGCAPKQEVGVLLKTMSRVATYD
jgi:hypothetical protein